MRKRTKEITSARIVNCATNYERTTKEWADVLSVRYGCVPEERRALLRQLRQVRMGQRRLCQDIRLEFKFVQDEDKKHFLDWLDDHMCRIQHRKSESDD